LNQATRYQLPVFWHGFSKFRKNRHGRRLGFKMSDIMTPKIQGPRATSKSVESGDQVSTSGFLARFIPTFGKTTLAAILDSKWPIL
jgi:hypothetical protein